MSADFFRGALAPNLPAPRAALREFVTGANAPRIASISFPSEEFNFTFRELDNPRDADTIRSLSLGTQRICNLRFTQFSHRVRSFRTWSKNVALPLATLRDSVSGLPIAAVNVLKIVAARQAASEARKMCRLGLHGSRTSLGGVTDGSTRRLCCGPEAPPNNFHVLLAPACAVRKRNYSSRASRRKLDGAWPIS